MKKILSFIMAAFTVCILSSVAIAEVSTKTLTLTNSDLSQADVSSLMLSFSFGGAKVNITQTDDTDFIVKAEVTFDTNVSNPGLSTNFVSGIFNAGFSSNIKIPPTVLIPTVVETWDITVGDYDVNTDLTINSGGVGGIVDFGGMPLKNCVLNFGGSGFLADFSEPTTRQVESILVTGGGSGFSMTNIGNSDFKDLKVLGGGQAVNLDFHGAYENQQHNVGIGVAGGAVRIVVPSNAGEKLDILSIPVPAIVLGEGWVREPRSFIPAKYQTSDYETQNVKIDFGITVAGSVVSVIRE